MTIPSNLIYRGRALALPSSVSEKDRISLRVLIPCGSWTTSGGDTLEFSLCPVALSGQRIVGFWRKLPSPKGLDLLMETRGAQMLIQDGAGSHQQHCNRYYDSITSAPCGSVIRSFKSALADDSRRVNTFA